MGCTQSREEFDKSELSISRLEQLNLKKKTSSKTTKVLTESEAHRVVADANLKAALTHPTVLKFLKAYSKEQGTEPLLDFYTRAVEIRTQHKEGNIETAIALFEDLIHDYLLVCSENESEAQTIQEADEAKVIGNSKNSSLSSLIIKVKPHYKSMILQHVGLDGKIERKNLNFAIEGLRMAQYQIFFALKESLWMPFCQSDAYAVMIKKKEVRTTITLYNSNNLPSTISDRFLSIMSEDKKHNMDNSRNNKNGNGNNNSNGNNNYAFDGEKRLTEVSMFSSNGSTR